MPEHDLIHTTLKAAKGPLTITGHVVHPISNENYTIQLRAADSSEPNQASWRTNGFAHMTSQRILPYQPFRQHRQHRYAVQLLSARPCLLRSPPSAM